MCLIITTGTSSIHWSIPSALHNIIERGHTKEEEEKALSVLIVEKSNIFVHNGTIMPNVIP
jgi:hypothetical protein